jgi:hypothetical protein
MATDFNKLNRPALVIRHHGISKFTGLSDQVNPEFNLIKWWDFTLLQSYPSGLVSILRRTTWRQEKMIQFDANAVIHINESLSDDQIHNIEKSLSGVNGIVSACTHIKTPHLMVVDYDPQMIRSRELLSHFQRSGVHASLIGGI